MALPPAEPMFKSLEEVKQAIVDCGRPSLLKSAFLKGLIPKEKEQAMARMPFLNFTSQSDQSLEGDFQDRLYGSKSPSQTTRANDKKEGKKKSVKILHREGKAGFKRGEQLQRDAEAVYKQTQNKTIKKDKQETTVEPAELEEATEQLHSILKRMKAGEESEAAGIMEAATEVAGKYHLESIFALSLLTQAGADLKEATHVLKEAYQRDVTDKAVESLLNDCVSRHQDVSRRKKVLVSLLLLLLRPLLRSKRNPAKYGADHSQPCHNSIFTRLVAGLPWAHS
jgi:hypothetical protein